MVYSQLLVTQLLYDWSGRKVLAPEAARNLVKSEKYISLVHSRCFTVLMQRQVYSRSPLPLCVSTEKYLRSEHFPCTVSTLISLCPRANLFIVTR